MNELGNKRHSLAHLLAASVLQMFPDAKLGVGPVIENGFYYDFLLPRPLVPEDLPKLEAEMKKLARANLPFVRQELSTEAAKEFFASKKQDFKIQLIEDIEKYGTTEAKKIAEEERIEADNGLVSLYQTGDFIDLCRGGHVKNTSEIDPDSFTLLKFSGAYWRGDQNNPQMQRIYGLAFDTAEELKAYQELQAKLEKSDHRILGPQLGMFLFHEYAPGIPFYLPNGMIVRNELEKFVRDVSYGKGYHEIRLPQLFDSELFKTSGHWEHYKDDMFTVESEERTYGLKPMNCPGHMLLYKQSLYSYRDLPLRFAEMTTLYRNELSGTLSGMTRVRAFSQDDSHIFVTPEQISSEVAGLLNKVKEIYSVFGMEIEEVMLATKPESSLGTQEEWSHAENSLRQALEMAGWQFGINEGDGAFYGPKIDMRIKDVLGRYWQLATIQLDFQMPQRFGLEYVAADGTRQTPIVIHRALLGSFERFLAILIEQYAGALPAWLSPVQLAILPIGENHYAYAESVAQQLKELVPNIRIQINDKAESVGKRIREAITAKVPYYAVIGDKEAEAQTLAVKARGDIDLGAISIQELADKLNDKIKNRAE